MSVFLITVDSLRADRINKELTPNLFELMQDSTYYTNAITNAPGTPQAFRAIFQSLTPSKDSSPYIFPNHRYLPEELKQQGYVTAGFTSNPYLSNFYNYNRGYCCFEDYRYTKPYKRISSELLEFLINSYKDANIINSRAIDFIDTHVNENLFLWLHYMDVHYPYASNLAEKLFTGKSLRRAKYNPNAVNKKDRNRIIGLYNKRVKEIDEEIGHFLSCLKERGLYDEGYIMVLADHGDEFGEHGYFFHGHSQLYDEMIKIPFIIKLPGGNRREMEQLTDSTQVFSSILNKKIPNNKDYVLSFTKSKKGEIISCRTLKWKLITYPEREDELYSLKKDPTEQENLIGSNEDIEKELRGIVGTHKKSKMEKERLGMEIKKLKRLSKI